jgi:hypothetical protein
MAMAPTLSFLSNRIAQSMTGGRPDMTAIGEHG